MFNQFQNPYLPQSYVPYIQPTQVVKVKGRNGAEAYTMGANSSALLLDESGTMVWLVTSDGAGYKTVAPYDITPHKDAPLPDYGTLEDRISKLEAIINEYTADSSTATRVSDAESVGSKADNELGERRWQSTSYASNSGAKQPER